MKICYLDNIIPIIEETVFLYSLFFWEEIHRWIPVFHQLRKTQCSWEDKRAGGFKKALKSVCSFHTVGIPAQYMFFDLASTCGLRIYFFLQLQTNMLTFSKCKQAHTIAWTKIISRVWDSLEKVTLGSIPSAVPTDGYPTIDILWQEIEENVKHWKNLRRFPVALREREMQFITSLPLC